MRGGGGALAPGPPTAHSWAHNQIGVLSYPMPTRTRWMVYSVPYECNADSSDRLV